MPKLNKTVTSITFKNINGQLVSLEKKVPVRVITEKELSRMFITQRKIPKSKFQWITTLRKLFFFGSRER
jgi:hypothetical protein